MPDLVLIAGANGAGKTTLARNLVPRLYPGAEFLNADEIQRSEGGAFDSPLAAGRELLRVLASTAQSGRSLMLETTLSSSNYARQIPTWRDAGYRVSLHFLEVVSADFAVARVAKRVAAGGHNIPEADIRRRYVRSIQHYSAVYRSRVDMWYHYRVDEGGPRLVDQGVNPG